MLQFENHAKSAFIVACVTLLIAGAGFKGLVHALNVYLKKEPVELRQSLPTLPTRLGQWRKFGEDGTLTEEVIETLGTHDYLNRNYAPGGDAENGAVSVHLAYYTGFIDAVPHVPDRCFEAGGWRKQTLPANVDLPIDQSGWRDDPEAVHSGGQRYRLVNYVHPMTGRLEEVRMPIGDFRIRVTEFQNPQEPDVRLYAGYFFIANGLTACSPEQVKLLAFNHSDRYAYYAKVQFTVSGDSQFEVEDFIGRVSDLATELLPPLMRCLPDWAELESESAEDESAA